ncbi:MAG TPA: cupin domain-containing protein [Thermomicrobiales bacterium]|nr:cupin domain-containing protein [Thermomicrobiales bacterium]
MIDIASTADIAGDAYWWQGSLMTIKARAADTGGALGLVEGVFYEGFGPPLHVHHREDEGMLVLDGEIRFRQGTEEFIAGPGAFVWAPREVTHAFTVQSPTARVLVIVTPGGLEQMFVEGGVRASDTAEPPTQEYDPDAARALAEKFGFDVVGPQLT